MTMNMTMCRITKEILGVSCANHNIDMLVQNDCGMDRKNDNALCVSPYIKKLRWKGPGTDTRRIRLDDTDEMVQTLRRHAKPRQHAADRRAAARDVGVRADVEVEEGGVGAFDEDAAALLQGCVEKGDAVDDHPRKLPSVLLTCHPP